MGQGGVRSWPYPFNIVPSSTQDCTAFALAITLQAAQLLCFARITPRMLTSDVPRHASHAQAPGGRDSTHPISLLLPTSAVISPCSLCAASL
jgi:hypothetical protein